MRFPALLSLLLAGLAHADAAPPFAWHDLPPLPDALGVAGPFAGESGLHLLVAGGANFPDGPPWEGGKKVWHDTVYALNTSGTWRVAGQLPGPRGYGVSVQTDEGVICAGGSDAARHYAEVFRLRLRGGDLTQEALPNLPMPLADAAGAKVQRTLYLAGGAGAPGEKQASARLFALDLDQPSAGWKELEPLPAQARIQPFAASLDGAFFLGGGAALEPNATGTITRAYLRDTWRYKPGEGWKRLADLPHPLAAAPTPAPAVGPSHFAVFGGNDGSKAGFQPVSAHPGFNPTILLYHTLSNTWAPFGEMPGARVTTPVVTWQGRWVIPSGEMRPGVRSPDVRAASISVPRRGFGWVNYAAFALYPALMMFISWRVGAKSNSDDFFRGGQRIPWWAVGLSIYATMLSSITFMAIPGKAYASDWSYILGIFTVPLLAPFIIRWYLPFFRQLNITSAYEYLELRFNLAARWFGSISFIILQLGRTAIVLYLPALALATVSNFAMTTCILIMGTISILMTFEGGLESAVWTDVAQTVILLVGAVAMLVVAVLGVPGGASEVARVAVADNKLLGGLDWGPGLTSATAWVILISTVFSNLTSYTAGQDVVQRFVATRDGKQAAKSIWTNAWMAIPTQLLFFSVGTALYAFYKAHPERLDPTLKTDAVFSLFIVQELPMGLAGLVVAAIFAAAQPTSSLNSIATAYVTDFHVRLAPGTPDAVRLRLGKIVTVLAGVLGTVLALMFARTGDTSVWDKFLGWLGMTGSALAALFFLGIFSRRATGAGAVAGALIAATVLAYVKLFTPLHGLTYAIIGFLTCAGAGWLMSLVLPSSPRPLDGLTLHTMNRKDS